MATSPAVRARMGSTTYYETTMTARELATSVRPASESDDWASASIEERMQRELNMARVKNQLVPYLAQHPDRFFGSFIVLVPKGSVEFEPLGSVIDTATLPAAYRAAESIGFLTLGKGELIALDGQHRLMAFRETITSGAQLGPYASEVGNDEVCVLVIEAENAQKTRRIFNKVNRHAKPTGRSDNIITSEDDGYAIVTRWMLDSDRGAPFAPRELPDGRREELVNWTSNTLSQRSTRITTISAVYEGVTDVLTHLGYRGFSEKDSPVAPSDDVLEKAFEQASAWFDELLKMDGFRTALNDLSSVPDIRYEPTNRYTLLLRPVGQIALVKGLVKAIERSRGTMSLTEAVRRANRIDWSAPSTSMWRDTIVRSDGRMVARKEAYELASDLIAYLIADEFTDEEEKHDLYERWNKARGRDPFTAWDELTEELRPEELPPPVAV